MIYSKNNNKQKMYYNKINNMIYKNNNNNINKFNKITILYNNIQTWYNIRVQLLININNKCSNQKLIIIMKSKIYLIRY